MRIIFLGTGPSEAIPRSGHKDILCKDARHGEKSRRTRSSVVVQDEKITVLIDAGPDIQEQLCREKIKKIDAVFLTHEHRDATGGLKWISPEIPIFSPNKNHKIKIGQISIVSFSVPHAFSDKFPTRGFIINKKFGYVSDCRDLPHHTQRILKNLNILTLDAAAYLLKRIPTHLSVEQAVEIAKQLKPKKLYLTQIGHTFPPHKIAEREIKKYAKKNNYSSQISLAYDGLKIKI